MATKATASSSFATEATESDPYSYQVGFGNSFASEALWLYRIRPSVAHRGFTKLPENPDLESTFLPLNPKVNASPTQLAWHPFDIPKHPVDFVDGLKTLAGNGDPTLREGLAVHMYLANTSMQNRAFCNNDGDFLILPQLGRLDIQTEFGQLMARPGELVVIQRGLRFKISLPDGPSRGYIQEIFGSHYILPDLGPLGANGLANPRDFEFPLAHFELDQSPWNIVHKLCGKFFNCSQDHTPFDVVAWHGNYVPYKYAMEKFITVGSISRDHIDPSIFCVLTAPSKQPNVPLADFLIFSPRWDVANDTFRPPVKTCLTTRVMIYLQFSTSIITATPVQSLWGFYTEITGAGAMNSSRVAQVTKLGFVPMAVVSYDEFKMASEAELKPMRVHEGTIAFMFETSMMLTITDYAMHRSGKLHEHEPKMWDDLKGEFMNHLPEVNASLEAVGRAPLHYDSK
ncbi:hypothetical protein DXG01_010738 [Tephrocybe rancida]|nr:hypothetical protein DXG01_010738 [Tephrocybe rancida]